MVPPGLNTNRGSPLEVTPAMPRPLASWPTELPNPMLLLTKETQLKPTRASFTRLGLKVWVQLIRLFFRLATFVLSPNISHVFVAGSFCFPCEYRPKNRSLSDMLYLSLMSYWPLFYCWAVLLVAPPKPLEALMLVPVRYSGELTSLEKGVLNT